MPIRKERLLHNTTATELVGPVVTPAGTLRSANAGRILLGLASLISVLCFFEFLACIKLVDYGNLIGPASGDVFLATNKSDPELLHVHPPHSHFTGTARGGNFAANFHIPASDTTLYRWDVKYDQNGFRNELDLKSADLAVIGDSFVEDITTSTPQLMTSLISQLQDGVVANLGQYGYGPLEELAVLKRYALPLHPRTIVWMFSEGSDLKDVIHYRTVTTRKYEAPSFWSAMWGRSLTRNVLAQLYVQLRRALRPAGVRRSGLIQESNGDRFTMYFLYTSAPLTQDDLGAINETSRTIAEAYKLCAAQESRLLFVFVPTKFRVFRPFCRFPDKSECRNWGVNDMPERLRTAVASISPEIGYLDLTPGLMDAVKSGLVPYHADDDHWSPEGNKTAAEAIHQYLVATGYTSAISASSASRHGVKQ